MTGFLGGSLIGVGQGGVDTGDIQKSLRFAASRSTYLSRTITTDATSTYFAVVKRGKLGAISPIFDSSIKFNANDTLTAFGLTTTAVFRDPTSLLFINVSNGGLYVNGVSFGAVTTSSITNPRIGFDGTNYFDGYIARCGVVGGTSSSYTNFGYQNTEINEWVTKSQSAVKAVVDAGGANSFMLDFDDGTSLTTLGYDKSSKGNNWTLNNHSLTAGVNYDWMDDVPGNSHCTGNPLWTGGSATDPALSAGNLTVSNGAGATYRRWASSIAVTSGKWYFEVTRTDAVGLGNYLALGVTDASISALSIGSYSGNPTSSGAASNEWALTDRGTACNTSTYSNLSGTIGTIDQNDVVQVCVDMDAKKIWFGIQNVISGDPVAGTGAAFSNLPSAIAPLLYVSGSGNNITFAANFGQRPFAYTPPTGFKALNQRNLAEGSSVTLSGSFTGNADVDGPVVWLDGSPDTLTINGNAVTFGTHADRLATGFKVRSSSASYNTAGSNTFVATITSNLKNCFKYNNAKDNT